MYPDKLEKAGLKLSELLNLKENGFEFNLEPIESKLFNMTFLMFTYQSSLLITFDDDARISFYKIKDKHFAINEINNNYNLITNFILDKEDKVVAVRQIINFLLTELDIYKDIDINYARSITYHILTDAHIAEHYFRQPLERLKIKEYDGLTLLDMYNKNKFIFPKFKIAVNEVEKEFNSVYGHILIAKRENIMTYINYRDNIVILYKLYDSYHEVCTIKLEGNKIDEISKLVNMIADSIFGNINLIKAYVDEYIIKNNLEKIEHRTKSLTLLDFNYTVKKQERRRIAIKEFLASIYEPVQEHKVTNYLFDEEYLSISVNDMSINVNLENDIDIICTKELDTISVKLKLKEKTKKQIRNFVKYLEGIKNFTPNTIDDISLIFKDTQIHISLKK